MWQELLGHIDFLDLVSALDEHRRTSTEYLQPAHLIGILNRRRTVAALTPVEPAYCSTHAGYPVAADGRCDQCRRHPEDLAPGAPAPQLTALDAAALMVGHNIEQVS